MKIFIIKNKWIYKGWGYKDSGFVTVTQGGTKLNPRYGAAFIGNRYELARSEIPHLFDWIVLNFGIDAERKKNPAQEPPLNYPVPITYQGE